MTTSAVRRIGVWLPIVAACALAPASHARADDDLPPAPRFRETVSLNTDGTVVKKLKVVRIYLAEEKWLQAVDMLQQIAETHGETLIAVSPGRYLNVELYCNMLVAAFPPAGLDAYRRKVDSTAQQWLETGRTQRDEAALGKIVRHAFASSHGDEALWLLGEWAWERGELSTARRHWSRLLPPQAAGGNPQREADGESPLSLNYPDAKFDEADVRARLVLCSVMEGDGPQVRRELRRFEQRHAEAEGRLAGRSGNLLEILRSIAGESREWTPPPPDGGMHTFGGNVQRNKVPPHKLDDLGGVVWSVPLARRTWNGGRSGIARRGTGPAALSDRGPLSYFPLVVDDVVLVNDAEAIYAYDLDSGKPKWPIGEDDDAVVYPPAAGAFSGTFSPLRGMVGTPRFTMTAHEGRVYARMGPPITGRARQEFRDFRSELVALDVIRGQGKAVWKVVSTDVPTDGPAWTFEGSPVVAGGRVYVALRRNHPQPQAGAACFDAETGRLIWKQQVCAALAGFSDEQNFVSHQLLTLADGRLFFSTNMGAVVALEADDGRLLWAAAYETQTPPSLSAWNDPKRHTLSPCLFHRGTVVAAPSDSDSLLALDAQTGVIRWHRQLPGGVRHLLGVGGDVLIVSGRRLWGLDLDTGRSAWPQSYGTEDPAGAGYGRGLLAGDVVYWPTPEDILVVEQTTGRLRNRFDLKHRTGHTGGNLTLADGRLLIAQPGRLVVFSEYTTRRPAAPFPISAIR